MKTIAFMPVKWSSERVPSKNTKLLNGIPLFIYNLQKLVEIKEDNFIDEIYLDTESDEIIRLAEKYIRWDYKIMKRDEKYASNKTDWNQLLLNEANNFNWDIYIQLLWTSPFIKKETIIEWIKKIKENNNYDSVVAIQKDKQYLWENWKTKYDINNIPNSKDLPDTVIESMSLYIIKHNTLFDTQRRIWDNPYLLELSWLETIDINYKEDFNLASLIEIWNYQENINFLELMKHSLTWAIVSDVLDDLWIIWALKNEYQQNFEWAKLFWRIRILKIKELENETQKDKIYDWLKIHSMLRNWDVVLVNNDVEDVAYWWELNTSLAMRNWAQWTIITWVTRDSNETAHMKYPTFSKWFYWKDIKNRWYVSDIDCNIIIDWITIKPDDYIYADREWVYIIPKNKFEIVKQALKNKIIWENNIKNDILEWYGSDQLLKRNWFF